MAAAKASGVTVDKVESIAIGQRGESGRAKTLLISGKSVSAPAYGDYAIRLDKDARTSFGKPARGGWTGSDGAARVTAMAWA